jgi:hypothetical protein
VLRCRFPDEAMATEKNFVETAAESVASWKPEQEITNSFSRDVRAGQCIFQERCRLSGRKFRSAVQFL